jgi:hypothetical protein
MVVRLGKHTDGATQSDLHVRGLEVAVGEVGCELKASSEVVGICLHYATALQLDGDTEEVLTSSDDSITPLKRYQQRSQNMPEKKISPP